MFDLAMTNTRRRVLALAAAWSLTHADGGLAKRRKKKRKKKVNAECDPSYPDVCIPPKSEVGDLDCGDVRFSDFRVRAADPHGFDGDNDGIGCET